MNKIDNRSNRFIFLPFCSLAQAFHAKGLVKYEWGSVITPVIDEVKRHNVNIIQMPCPEALFPNLEESLMREPMSYNAYNSEEGFRLHCRELANQVLNQVKAIVKNKYEIVGILGIQYSPSCAVELQYTNKGNVKLSGIFIQELQKLLKEENIEVPFLGINRRGIKASLKRLEKLLNEHSI